MNTHLSSRTMKAPTVRDGTLPATPRRLRLKAPHPLQGEVLDFYVGRSFFARIGDARILVQVGDYMGYRGIVTHHFILSNPHMWERVEEPFHLIVQLP